MRCSGNCLQNNLFCRQAADVWGPGDILPLSREPDFVPESPIHVSVHRDSELATQSVLDMLQLFQKSVETQFTGVCDRLESMNSRMSELEKRQKVLEDGIQSSSLSSSANSTPKVAPAGAKRNHITPPALQVIHMVDT